MLHKSIPSLISMIALVLLMFSSNTAFAQCPVGTGQQWPTTTLTPNSSWQSASENMYAGEYALFNVVSGTTYEFSLCVADGGLASYDSELTLYANTNLNVALAYEDDICGDDPKITWTSTFTGLLRVYVHQYPCLTNNTNTTLRYRSVSGGNPAPANDNCVGAFTLPVGADGNCVPFDATLNGATQSLPATTCAGFNEDDVWFRAIATGPNMIVEFAPTQAMATLIAEVFTGPNCNALTLAGCVTASAPGAAAGFELTTLTAGEIVYWRVFDAGFTPISLGNIALCAYTESSGGSTPVNNACAGATVINAGGTCTPINATLQGSTPTAPTTTCSGTNNGDVWFQIFPADTAVTLEMTPLGTVDGVMEVFVGTCGNLVSLGCVDATAAGGLEIIDITGFTPGTGQSIYVRIFDWSATVAANQAFTFCAYWEAPISQNNDECGGATPLVLGNSCNPVNGTTLNATGSAPSASCSVGGSTAQDVWYSFVAGSSSATITVNPIGNFDAVIQYFSGPCNNLVSRACSDFFIAGNAENLSATGLTPGQTYYIRVYDYEGLAAASNDFTICVVNYPTSPNNECAGAIPITVSEAPLFQPFTSAQSTQSLAGCTGNANDDVWFSFVAGQNPPGTTIAVGGDLGFRTVFQVFSGTCGNLTSVACVNDVTSGTYDVEERLFTTLTPGQTYFMRVYDFTATNSNSTFYVAIQGVPTAGCNIPPPTVNSTGTTICTGGSVTLTTPLTAGLTYQWLNNGVAIGGATANTFIVTQTGSYTVRITDAQNCTGISAPIVITPGAGPSVSITPSGTSTVCIGSSLILSATAGNGFTYQWLQNGNPIGGATSQTFSANLAGNYSVTVTDGAGCSTTSSAVTLNTVAGPTASISAGGSTNICPGTPVVLTATPVTGATYQWQLNGVNIAGATSTTFSATEVGNYTIVVTTSACSSTSNTVSITATQAPNVTVSASGPLSFCQGGNVQLSVPAGSTSYQWFNGGVLIAGSTQNTFTATTSGSFTVTATLNGCSVSSVASVVTVSAAPNATITADGSTSVCQGSSVTLNAPTGTGLTYQWNLNGSPVSGGTLSSITANQSGNYSVTVSSGPGCSATSSNVSVSIISAPNVTISASGSLNICQGSSVNLSAGSNPGLTYQWLLNGATIGGATSAGFAANAAGNYTVTATNTSGCASTSQPVTVTVNPLPNATVTPNGPTTFCVGGNVLLQAATGAGYSYQWTNGGNPIAGAVNNVLNVSQTGTYGVIVTDLNQCSSTSTTFPVNVAGTQATISFTGAPAICDGNSVLLTATAGSGLSYQWLNNGVNINGATQQTLTVTTAGNYTVSVTDQNNCTSTSAPQQISVGQTPSTPGISSNGITSFCAGDNVALTADVVPGVNIQWLLDNQPIAGATNSTFNANAPGVYSVLGTNAANCQAISSTITLSVLQRPEATVIANGALTFCLGDDVTLTANSTVSNSNFQWLNNGEAINGATGSTFVVNASGSYTVSATAPNGCSSVSAVINVTANALPNVSMTLSKDTVCINEAQVTLTGGSPAGGTYAGPGVTGNVFSPLTAGAGAHSITYTFADNNGCEGIATVTLFVDECTSINDLESATFTLYPNPAQELLVIAFDEKQQLSDLSIWDISGRMVQTRILSEMAGRAVMSISDLAPGSYTIRATIGKKLISGRFVKAD